MRKTRLSSAKSGVGLVLFLFGLFLAGFATMAVSGSTVTMYAPPAPDNHGFQFFAAGALKYNASVSTTQPDAVIFMIVQMNTVSPTKVADSSGLTWNFVPSFSSDGVASLYWASVPSAETTTVTITVPDSGEHFNVLWFDALGVNLDRPLDPNPSLPTRPSPTTGPTVTASGSTSNAYDMIVAYDAEVAACGAGPITFNPPFISLQGDTNCGYSMLNWLAYDQVTSVETGVTWTPFTNPTPGEAFTTVFAIQGISPPSGTTSTTSSTQVSTTPASTTTASASTATSTGGVTTIATTTLTQTVTYVTTFTTVSSGALTTVTATRLTTQTVTQTVTSVVKRKPSTTDWGLLGVAFVLMLLGVGIMFL